MGLVLKVMGLTELGLSLGSAFTGLGWAGPGFAGPWRTLVVKTWEDA